METTNLQTTTAEEMKITTAAINDFKITQKWTKFLAIMGFIGIGLMFLIGIGVVISGFFTPAVTGMPSSFGVFYSSLGIFYLVIAAVYFIPVYYLFRFSTGLRKALTDNDSNVLESALHYLMAHFRFIGIFTIAILALYLLIIIGLVIFAATGAYSAF